MKAVGEAGGRPIAVHLAAFIGEQSLDRLPASLVRRMKSHILDTIADGIAGRPERSTEALLAAIPLAAGDAAEATIFGTGKVASADVAALANGAMAHALELDDDHRLATLHPGAVVVPAALAAAEAAGASGARFLLGVILGYEVMCRAGEAFMGRQFYRGFHPTGTCGVFGAAVAAGIAFGLDERQMVNALGIAGTQAAGLGEWRADGSWIKRLHPGRSAQSGLLAARLAANGFTGPATIFEGESGFLAAFRHEDVLDADALTRGLGSDFTAGRTAFKPYPGCRFAHAAVDLALDLHGEGIDGSNVESIAVRVFRTDILNDVTEPPTPVIAQFSVPYLVATAMQGGSLTLVDLEPGAIARPGVISLARRISVTVDPDFTARYPERYPTELRVRFTDGTERVAFSDCPRGDPEAAVYAADDGRYETEIADKAAAVLSYVGLGGLAGRLADEVGAIERAPTLATLAALVGGESPVPARL